MIALPATIIEPHKFCLDNSLQYEIDNSILKYSKTASLSNCQNYINLKSYELKED
ncbi:protein of unknown function [Candidatus Nitrosocosmicus franklandus]|uniref:Uncharacterized protein n=1 Tax=Candidatus Nitrosocosmicus franklandianus TaxID=1798806 RepID=A0A484I6U6_9ARCH|nr:protein of unknown function [Candidatus Nitrosocosmicus franklandus]